MKKRFRREPIILFWVSLALILAWEFYESSGDINFRRGNILFRISIILAVFLGIYTIVSKARGSSNIFFDYVKKSNFREIDMFKFELEKLLDSHPPRKVLINWPNFTVKILCILLPFLVFYGIMLQQGHFRYFEKYSYISLFLAIIPFLLTFPFRQFKIYNLLRKGKMGTCVVETIHTRSQRGNENYKAEVEFEVSGVKYKAKTPWTSIPFEKELNEWIVVLENDPTVYFFPERDHYIWEVK